MEDNDDHFYQAGYSFFLNFNCLSFEHHRIWCYSIHVPSQPGKDMLKHAFFYSLVLYMYLIWSTFFTIFKLQSSQQSSRSCETLDTTLPYIIVCMYSLTLRCQALQFFFWEHSKHYLRICCRIFFYSRFLTTLTRHLPIKFVSGDDLFRLFVKIGYACTQQ